MSSQCIFPAELICDILCHTSPPDVVRWRTVSRWFFNLTYEPRIWKTLYANAPFLRPPGPFPTASFQHAFAKSAQLAQSWTTQDLCATSRIRIPFEGCVTKNRHLVDSRWLVVCQENRRFVLYDTHVHVESFTPEPRVIWEQTQEIWAWDKCVVTSEQGEGIVYVLTTMKDPPRMTLLELRLKESGVVRDTATWDIPVSELAEELVLEGGQRHFARSRFLSIPGQPLHFDTRTRAFYELPAFRFAMSRTRSYAGSDEPDDADVVLTNTHVVVLNWFPRPRPFDANIVVQAFAVPDDQPPPENGKGVLRLTHEGTYSTSKSLFAIIQNSTVDPTTGTINIKLLERHWKWDGFQSSCVHLKLQRPSPDNVSDILITQDFIDVQGHAPFNDDLHFCTAWYDISDDGYARGLFTRHPSCTSNTTFGVVKFTIDATQDICEALISRFSCAGEWDDIVSPIEHVGSANDRVVLDGVRGRLIFVDKDSSNDAPDGYVEDAGLVIVNIE